MYIKETLRKCVLYLGLGMASLLGASTKVEEIEELLFLMTQARVEVVIMDDELK